MTQYYYLKMPSPIPTEVIAAVAIKDAARDSRLLTRMERVTLMLSDFIDAVNAYERANHD